MDNNQNQHFHESNYHGLDYQYSYYRAYCLGLNRQREEILRVREELDRQQALLTTRRYYLEQETAMVNRQLENAYLQGSASAMYPHLYGQYPVGYFRNSTYQPYGSRYAYSAQPQLGRAAPGNIPNLRMPAPIQVSREYPAELGNCRACLRRAAVFSCQDHRFNYCSVECQVAGCFLFERQTAPPSRVEELLVPRGEDRAE